MVKASAYVKDGRLIVIGVAQMSIGPVPFSYDCPVPEGVPEGPLDMNRKGSKLLESCLAGAEVAIKKRIQRGAIRVGAENLVLRARQGDQNAMAMLIAVRKKARAGAPRAIAALRAIKIYIEDHPPTETCDFGYEAKKNVETALAKHVEHENPLHYVSAVLTYLPHVRNERAIVLIANGPLVCNNLLSAVSSSLGGPREEKQFKDGFNGKPIPSDAAMIGSIFKKARELQAARRGKFSPLIAYELGF